MVPRLPGARVGVGGGGTEEGEPAQHRRRVYTGPPHLGRETEASGHSEGRAPSSGPSVQSCPVPSPFLESLGPSRAPGDAM